MMMCCSRFESLLCLFSFTKTKPFCYLESPIDCTDIHVSQGSGVYTIYPKGIGRINVYCDLDTNNSGGGWTVSITITH